MKRARLCLVFFVGFFAPLAFGVVLPDPFYVRDIFVSLGGNPVEAKEKAISEAKTRALKDIWVQLSGVDLRLGGASFIRSYGIAWENIREHHYVGRFRVHFRPSKVRDVLRHSNVPWSEFMLPPVLVVVTIGGKEDSVENFKRLVRTVLEERSESVSGYLIPYTFRSSLSFDINTLSQGLGPEIYGPLLAQGISGVLWIDLTMNGENWQTLRGTLYNVALDQPWQTTLNNDGSALRETIEKLSETFQRQWRERTQTQDDSLLNLTFHFASNVDMAKCFAILQKSGPVIQDLKVKRFSATKADVSVRVHVTQERAQEMFGTLYFGRYAENPSGTGDVQCSS